MQLIIHHKNGNKQTLNLAEYIHLRSLVSWHTIHVTYDGVSYKELTLNKSDIEKIEVIP